MMRIGTPGSLTTTTATLEQEHERGIRRLRLTLRPEDSSSRQNERTKGPPHSEGKMVNSSWMRKNGLVQRESPQGRESPVDDKPYGSVSDGVERGPMSEPRVFGVVQLTGDHQQQEMTARDWPVSHLRDEMRYIRDVRDSLEKVRERMYGQFGGMQQSIQKLSQDLKLANSQKLYLEAEVRMGQAALDSFDQMNSSLISANIDLQKSLLETCQGRVGSREEMRALRASFEKTEQRLREREKQLIVAQAENRELKEQVEANREASARALREMNAKLQREYEEKLQELQRKHAQETEALRAQLEDYTCRLEEAERNMRLAEAKIAERDQRISEVERLLDCMAQEKGELTQKLCDCEKRLRSLENGDQTDSGGMKKTEQLQLQKATSDLKERIKHLNDMVFCQQRKVKTMIEEVETLRASVAQKDMYISELLDRIAIVECESVTENKPLTKEVGVGCDLPVRQNDTESHKSLIQSRTTPTLRSPSRLEYSLLQYTPMQYSSMLSSNTQQTATSPGEDASDSSPAQSDSEEPASPKSPVSELSPSNSNPSRSSPSRIHTPFMKLMELSAKYKVNEIGISEVN
ncbi:myocardial zonula adherens protein isoform X2 [Electrophorus electricus]|uniref:myocardial zonula adherens protein isoform X2 n=1 Tax=Electrophorus electricus TaxID=8005 RepID=UPI0015D04C61|nr:myocardial zonula adherens protein isoform X2 [Electrophorus electricus]